MTGYIVPRLGSALASEWTKLRSVRSTWLTLAVAAAVGLGLTVLFTVVIGSDFPTMDAQARQALRPVSVGTVGLSLALVLFIVFGTGSTAPEFASRMISVTLAVTARRGRWLAAKALVVGAVAAVAGTVLTVASFVLGQSVLAGAGAPHASLGDSGVVRVLAGWTAEMVVFSVLAVFVAVLLRSAAGTIAALLAVIYLPAMFGDMLPAWVSEYVLRFLPGMAAGTLAELNPDPASPTYLPPWAAGLVLVGWIAGLALLARATLSARDAR
ncbi:hypothetical protein [Amycolatopsis suaedae]|uniref:ABC transporter permease n=1 Tax=Amycolatopsis suaedae TaxID=2510978 RepID=A0A4Q7IZ58_9PSEU|nr:hypothetical protein [Amycolatopsis suaedae]RZQ59759.1 hypothetical protein EWH70_32035 [Amycolatopsis suaedae]